MKMYPFSCTLMLHVTELGSGSGIPYACRKNQLQSLIPQKKNHDGFGSNSQVCLNSLIKKVSRLFGNVGISVLYRYCQEKEFWCLKDILISNGLQFHPQAVYKKVKPKWGNHLKYNVQIM